MMEPEDLDVADILFGYLLDHAVACRSGHTGRWLLIEGERVTLEASTPRIIFALARQFGEETIPDGRIVGKDQRPDLLESWEREELLYLAANERPEKTGRAYVDVATSRRELADACIAALGGGRARTRDEMLHDPEYPQPVLAAALRRWEAGDDSIAAACFRRGAEEIAARVPEARAMLRWGMVELGEEPAP